MSKENQISIYVPLDKQGELPIERLAELAEKRNRSVNHLAVQAILEYLDANEPLRGRAESPARVDELSPRIAEDASGPPTADGSSGKRPLTNGSTRAASGANQLEQRGSVTPGVQRASPGDRHSTRPGCLVIALCGGGLVLLVALLLALH